MEEETFVGVVIFFNKGYGFIKQDVGDDIFVHYSDINCEGFKNLKKDQSVSYQIGKNNQGRDKAINVVILK